MFAGAIWISADRIEVTSRGRPADRLSNHVLGVLVAEPEWHSVRDWLMFLAASSVQDVGRRLEQAGYLPQVSSRRHWRGTKLVPADPDAAFAPLIRVRSALDPMRMAAQESTALAGLAAACGLGPRLLAYGPPGARRQLADRIQQLDPDLRQMIGHTQAAVASALLSHRM